MKTYRMIINTETVNHMGRLVKNKEIVQHIQEADLDKSRETARLGAPIGSTRTIKVVKEI